MPFKTFLFYTILILFFTSTLQLTPLEAIYDVSADLVANKDDEVIQLKISWKDNITLSQNISYNVIVSLDPDAPMTTTAHCSIKSCAEYGILEKSRETLIPKDPMAHLEPSSRECVLHPGCSYTIKVETSKGTPWINKSIAIPVCIFDDCICDHGMRLPIVNVTARLLGNDTMELQWVIVSPDKSGKIHQLDKLYLSVHQHTNSLLSWGGMRESVGWQVVPLNASLKSPLGYPPHGVVMFHANTNFLPGTIYTIKSHVVDVDNCFGPEKMTTFIYNKTDVLIGESDPVSKLADHHNIIKISIAAGIVIILGIILAYCIIRIAINNKKTEKHIPLRHIDIPMAQNFMYVDKDIQEALDNGTADLFEIPQNFIALGKEIGCGAFGQVCIATLRNYKRSSGNLLVAVKKLKENPNEHEMEEFLSEIQTLKNAGRHENIVALLGCCTVTPPLMMIMEYVGRGDLLKYLRRVREQVELYKLMKNARAYSMLGIGRPVLQQHLNVPADNYLELKFSTSSYATDKSGSPDGYSNAARLRPSMTETQYTFLSQPTDDMADSEHLHHSDEGDHFEYAVDHKELHNFAVQICKGMRHLEERGIIHRDLAARNILIDDRKTLKISDFGLSRKGIYVNTKGTKLPLRWLSTEAILEKFYSNKSDVWSFGVVLWEIGNLGAVPYAELNNQEIVTFLVTGSRLEKPEICTSELYDLMVQCWNVDLQERPSFEDILNWLQPLKKSIYVDINSLSDDYVFPPAIETIAIKRATK